MSGQEQDSNLGGVIAARAVQGVPCSQASRPGSHEGPKGPQADADIFDALFSKWGRDEETNMVGSFDDLLWDEGAAAVAAAAASMGWQRTATPSAPSQQLSKPSVNEQLPPQQHAWEQASVQLQQQQAQQSKPCHLIGQQLLCGTTVIRPPGKPPSGQDSCGDKTHAVLPPAADVGVEPLKVACCAELQQLHPGCMLPAPLAVTGPMAAATAAPRDAKLADATAMSAPQLAGLQQLSAALASGSLLPDGDRMLPQLSLQSMLHLQQQLMAEVHVAASVGQAAQQPTQQQQQQQQAPAPISSMLSYQPSAQQLVQPAAAASGNCWLLPCSMSSAAAAAGNAAGMGGTGLGGLAGSLPGSTDAAAAAFAMQSALQQQHQQQQLLRPPGLPMGLPFPGAGPGINPGFGLFSGVSSLPSSAPLGFPPAAGGAMFPPTALYAAAAALAAQQQALAMPAQQQLQVMAGQQPLLWQQTAPQQQQQQHQHRQQQQPLPHSFQEPQVVAQPQVVGPDGQAGAIAAGSAAATDASLTRQSFTAMMGPGAVPAAAVVAAVSSGGGGVGLMGPPAPHPPAAHAPVAAAAAGVMNSHASLISQLCGLPQLAGQVPQLPADLLSVLGLAAGAGQLGAAGAAPAAAAAPSLSLPPLYPGSWPLHLAGLLQPPPVQTTNVLQLAMMMQSALQASALPGSGDTQQAAMVVAALQGLAANMRLFMPWTNTAMPWQPRPVVPQQQELLNGSCLASGAVLPRQLSSSYGAGWQKATLQFGSQPQTSTTDISGQAGLLGCHSHSTAVAAVAAAAAAAGTSMAGLASAGAVGALGIGGLQRLDSLDRPEASAARPKPKRKQRHNDNNNRGRYESRKIRANNRVRVKGRFVKMGPNGPILPGSEANEQHHSEHEVSDAELTDPEIHEHHGSSGRPGATVAGTAVAAAAAATADAALAGSPGVADLPRISRTGGPELELALPPAGDAPEPIMPQAGPDSHLDVPACFRPASSAGEGPSWSEDAFKPYPGSGAKPCCTAGTSGCAVCRSSSPAAGDRPCLGHISREYSKEQLQQQFQHDGRGTCCPGGDVCAAHDRALGHAGDGPCRCDDTTCASGGHQGWATAGRETSASGLGVAPDDNAGQIAGHANRLVHCHSNRAASMTGAAGGGVAAGRTHSACSEQQLEAALADVPAADGAAAAAGQGVRRGYAATHCSLGIVDASAAAAAAAGQVDQPASKRYKVDQGREEQPELGAVPDAAEAAAMPVPESEMPQAGGLLEQWQLSAMDPCEAAAQPVPEHLARGLPSAAAEAATAAAAAAATAGTAVSEPFITDMVMVEAPTPAAAAAPVAACDHGVEKQHQTNQAGLSSGTQQVDRPAAATGQEQAPADGHCAAAVAAAGGTALPGSSQAMIAQLAQAAVTGPGGSVVAAAALQHCTSALRPGLPPGMHPPPPVQTGLWGSTLGFRAWGVGSPNGAVMSPPSLPHGMPLPLNLLAAAASAAHPGLLPPSMPGTSSAVAPGSMPPPPGINLTATLTAMQQVTNPGALAAAAAAVAAGNAALPLLAPGGGGSSGAASGLACLAPWALPRALMGPGQLAAAAAATRSPSPLLGGQLAPNQLVQLQGGCWPLAAAVGKWPASAQRPRQRRRGQATAESEQTDSCPK